MEPNTAPPDDPRTGRGTPPWVAIALGVLAAALALILLIVLLTDDDDDADVTADTTTSTVEETTSTTAEETTSTTSEATTTTSAGAGELSDEEAANVVWPAPGAGEAEALDAAESFAEEVLGFVDPDYGDYQAGDNRSGEVEVRPVADGPVTTIGVREMGDGAWYVVVVSSSEVELIRPTARSAVDHPLDVEGWGRGFEGQVRVAIFERGETTPLAETTVTAGSGEDPEPFTGTLDWSDRGTGGWGVVIATTAGGPDGTTWAATAVPVGFIGGD
jgi:hypothetical protein